MVVSGGTAMAASSHRHFARVLPACSRSCSGSLLGINYTDYQFDNSGNALDRKVDKTVQRWMSRQYDSHGRGGIFPLESVPEFYESDEFQNQNRLELWYQMQLYLAENYDI